MVDAAGDARASIGLPRQPTPTDTNRSLPVPMITGPEDESGYVPLNPCDPGMEGAVGTLQWKHRKSLGQVDDDLKRISQCDSCNKS